MSDERRAGGLSLNRRITVVVFRVTRTLNE